jgi:hypothetical protein
MKSAPITETESSIRFSGELQAAQDRGELIALATVFYRPADDHIVMYFPSAISEEEAVAVLRAHKCFPK